VFLEKLMAAVLIKKLSVFRTGALSTSSNNTEMTEVNAAVRTISKKFFYSLLSLLAK
jgi:hypothetical protein